MVSSNETDDTMYSIVTQKPQGIALTPSSVRKKKKQQQLANKESGNIFGSIWQASSLTRNI